MPGPFLCECLVEQTNQLFCLAMLVMLSHLEVGMSHDLRESIRL